MGTNQVSNYSLSPPLSLSVSLSLFRYVVVVFVLANCSKMGFMKVKAPNSHNRKRLAVESRRHASRDDSHMFIIKLPPNLHYYNSPNGVQQPQQQQLHQMINGVNDNAQKIASFLATEAKVTAAKTTQQAVQQTEATAATEASALKTNGKKVNGIPLGYTKTSNSNSNSDCSISCPAWSGFAWLDLAWSGLFWPRLDWPADDKHRARMCTKQIAKRKQAKRSDWAGRSLNTLAECGISVI